MTHLRAANQSKFRAAIRYDGDNAMVAIYAMRPNVLLLQNGRVEPITFTILDPAICAGYTDWIPADETTASKYLSKALASVEAVVKKVSFVRKQ